MYDPQDYGLGARAKPGAVARPIPEEEYLPFVNEFIKASCVCRLLRGADL